MNEEQYKDLCDACDRILLAPDSTVECIAIPWLHVMREHPVFLTNYVNLFDADRGKPIILKLWSFLRNQAMCYRQVMRSLLPGIEPWYGNKNLPKRIDFLFISHLLNTSHAGKEDDFYFAALANDLVANGHSAVIVLINHTNASGPSLKDKWSGCRVPRIILSDSLQFSPEISLRRRMRKESVRLAKLARDQDSELSIRVLEGASKEALSGGALSAIRLFSQIGTLISKLKPKAIVVTHEGHAYERMAFAAARSVCPSVRRIGYQHAALFRLQHAIRRNLATEYNPDHILTSGRVGKAQLERAPGLKGITVSVLGSNRIFKADENKSLHQGQSNQTVFREKRACLVLPEGIESECHLLFEFSLACAQSCKEINFIWRLHPIVTYESLAKQNPKLRNLPENIFLSTGTLDDDISRCQWALYRGTTAIVQAVMAGIRPIYLQVPGEMTIDPLYELKEWLVKVTTVSEFQSITNGNYITSANCPASENQHAIRYCKDFFLPFDSNVLPRILGMKDQKGVV